ncbi:hypothetical protein SK854_09305 [Lentzea sp. BCCO 10_0061]|uniref:Uncharacterized protein n=1 Tax=Lentzea sokolovensis TaxID=3095429 RepID=A0ABU4UU74_9PSEU|nr:hypothetical protein [Lentzea sp. BCCO 10_0061]MDX8142308.1 hypothetical protein [Lentzea sp. BCCO 10_0061]
MRFEQLARPLNDAMSGRFVLVNYLPTAAGAVCVLVLVWAGAPGPRLDFGAAWRTAGKIGVGEAFVLVLAVTLLSLLVQPLQLALVRLLEGAWPRFTAGPFRWWQRKRRARLARSAEVSSEEPAEVQRAGQAAVLLRQRFPHDEHLVRPTALGNVLTAMEDQAGRAYGLDAVVVWPRLYPVLGEQVRAVVADRRDSMDLAARLSVTLGLTAVVSAALLHRAGWWLLVALGLLVAARLAYRGCVQAALAYGEAVETAFDLHRFDLYRALHLPLPDDVEAEKQDNRRLSAFWRQGRPVRFEYRHESPEDQGPK